MAGALREVLAKFGFQIEDADKLDAAEKKADNFADKLKDVAGLFLGDALVDKVKGFVLEIQEAGDALNDASDQLGVSAQTLQQWQVAAKFAGAETEELNAGIRVLNKTAAEAKSGGGDLAASFKKLGVNVSDASGKLRPTADVLKDVLVGLSSVESPAERSALAMQLLGKAGTTLAPLTKDGAEGLEALLGKLDELGGGFSQDALEGAGAVGDSIDELNYAVTSLKSRIAASFFPTLSQLIQFLTKTSVAFGKTTDGTNAVQASIIVLGAAATKVAIGMYAKYAPMVALIALLVLLVDDVITAFKGGDSVIGKFIDKLLGKGAGKDFFKWVGEGVDDLGKKLDKTPGFADKVEEVFSSVGSTLVKFFVDDLPEAWSFFWKDINKQIGSKGKTFTDFLKTMFTDLKTWFFDWVEDVTDEIINGFVDGIKEKWDDVIESFEDLAKGIRNKFKEVFKIKSPAGTSKEDVDNIAQGYILQFEARAPDIEKSAEKAYSAALPPGRENLYAPILRAPVGATAAGSNVTYAVNQTNHNKFDISGSGASGLTNQVRDGAKLALNDDRNAALAALETLAEA